MNVVNRMELSTIKYFLVLRYNLNTKIYEQYFLLLSMLLSIFNSRDCMDHIDVHGGGDDYHRRHDHYHSHHHNHS